MGRGPKTSPKGGHSAALELSQVDKFRDLARQLETDDDEARFGGEWKDEF